MVVCGIFAPWIMPHDPTAGNLSTSLIPPVWEDGGTWSHMLGTDQQGRDILSRLIAGSQVSLLIAVTAVGISGVVGLLFALLGGYYGGIIDAILGRIVDAMLSLPFLMIAIVLATVLSPGVKSVILILGFTGWSGYARVLRGEVLRLKQQDFVALARVGGCSTPRILLRYITPGLINTFIVLATLQLGTTILAAATLSFLGIGVQPPRAAWGLMLADGRQYVTYAWWLAVFPGVAIMLTVLSVNTIGDWLRVRLDPKLRQV
jgi:peptide/nickel transport system permease protein